ncbi:MAG TPA: peptidylprolyl isomerase [Burkholderiaceae bacterium]|nr:peptidylprolyl isomerase [Burkholderiaceae bacterium]
MRIEPNVWVTVRYRLHDSQGEAIEEGEREWTYLHGGYGAVFPKIEDALAGRETGYATSLYLEPEDTFGDYDASLLKVAPRDRFPAGLEPGMTFDAVPGEPADGELYTVTDFTEEAVVLDGNHPLAGMALRFDLEVEDVRAATEDEIAEEARRRAAEEE